MHLVGDTEDEVKMVVQTLRELARGNRKFYVPVIGALSQLSLTKDAQLEAFVIATEALKDVDELDFPVVVKGMLKTLNKSNALEIMETVRCYIIQGSLDNLSHGFSRQVITLLFEIMGNVFQVNLLAGKNFDF